MRTAEEWRRAIDERVQGTKPALARHGLAPSPRLTVALGGERLATYDARTTTITLGVEDLGAWRELLGTTDDELDRALGSLLPRLAIAALARHLRVESGSASDDEWLETQAANEVACAATASPPEAERAFLERFAARALHALRLAPASPKVTDLIAELSSFVADLQRAEAPDFDRTIASLVAESDPEVRRRSESELVLLSTLAAGPVALRRTAAELFAEEASAEGLARLLSSGRMLPADVRLMLASALQRQGAAADAEATLSALATSPRTPAPAAAAAALLLGDGAGVDSTAKLSDLEDQGLIDALRLVHSLPSESAKRAVEPFTSHPQAAARREAYRLLADSLDEADAWAGASDAESAIRAASIARLPARPSLARALAKLVLDSNPDVRQAALGRARSDEALFNDVATILAADESDDARLALSAVLAEKHPALADEMFGRLLARAMRPHTLAFAASQAAHPRNEALALVASLALDTLARRQRELLELASQARRRADWLEIFLAFEEGGSAGEEAARLLMQVLPEGWYQALHAPPSGFEPVAALRELSVTHPEPFVRAATLLYLARSGHESPSDAASRAQGDPSPAVAEIAHVLSRGPSETTMTAIEKALFLRTVPLFRSVPTPNLLALAGVMRAGEHAAGEAMVRQGELGDRLFVLHVGAAEARRDSAAGPVVLSTLGPGSVFGEMSLFDAEPRSASVVATEPCRTLVLDGASFHRLGLEYPEMLWEVCRVLSNRLRAVGQTVGGRAVASTPTRAA